MAEMAAYHERMLAIVCRSIVEAFSSTGAGGIKARIDEMDGRLQVLTDRTAYMARCTKTQQKRLDQTIYDMASRIGLNQGTIDRRIESIESRLAFLKRDVDSIMADIPNASREEQVDEDQDVYEEEAERDEE